MKEDKLFKLDLSYSWCNTNYHSVKETLFHTMNKIESNYKRLYKNNILETGIEGLEFPKGQITVIASRPSIGKTSFVLSLLNQLAVKKYIPVGFFNTDYLDGLFLGKRLIQIISNVSSQKINSGMLKEIDINKITDAGRKLHEAPIYFSNIPNCSLEIFLENATYMIENEHIQFLIIDDIELFADLQDSEKEEYRGKLEEVLQSIQALAEQYQIPVLITMSLPATENNSEPTIDEFNRYMIIPRLCEMVMFIHRERLKDEVKNQTALYIVAKNNNNSCWTRGIKFWPSTNSFTFEEE